MACALTNGVLHRQSFKKRTLLLFWENLQVKNVHSFILGILKLILEVQLERNFAQPGRKYAQPGTTSKSVSNVCYMVRLGYVWCTLFGNISNLAAFFLPQILILWAAAPGRATL